MKKLTIILMSFVMLFSLTACSETEPMQEVLQDPTTALLEIYNSNFANADIEYFDMTLEMQMQEPDEINAEVSIIADISDLENPKMQMEMDIPISGMPLSFDIYYVDQFAYIDAFGMKIKQAASYTDLGLDHTTFIPSQAVTEDYFKDVSVFVDEENKTTTFNFGYSTGFADSMAGFTSLTDLNSSVYSDVTGSITVDSEGNIKQQTTYFLDDTGAEIGKVTMIFNSFNEAVSMTFPDFSDYVEADLNSLLSF